MLNKQWNGGGVRMVVGWRGSENGGGMEGVVRIMVGWRGSESGGGMEGE